MSQSVLNNSNKNLSVYILLAPFFMYLLTACTSGPLATVKTIDIIPAGSQILVKKKLTISANNGRVYLQNGQIIEHSKKDQYKPHCWFLSWKVLDVPQFVDTDTFTVTASQRLEELVYRPTPVKLAANTSQNNLLILSMASITAIEQKTILDIHSDKQPDIRQLTCSYWDSPVGASPLTLSEIQGALGDIVLIKIKEPS